MRRGVRSRCPPPLPPGRPSTSSRCGRRSKPLRAPPSLLRCSRSRGRGSQALAHLILSRSIPVDTLSVLDVGCGSGVAATAAALCGAHACAVDIDPSAVIASVELARRHGVSVAPLLADPIADPSVTSRSDVILGGDLFYCEPGARKGSLAVRRWLAEGRAVYLADAGRPFFDPCGLPHLWTGCVPVPRVVEGVSTRTVRVYGPRR